MSGVRSCVLLAALVAGCGARRSAAAPTHDALPVAGEDAPVEAPIAELSAEGAEPPVPAAPLPAAVAPPDPPGPRIGSIKFITWIFAAPSHDARKLGYLREGTSVALAAPDAVAGQGCRGGWFAVKPFGFVCHDSSTVRDLADPLFAELTFPAQRDDLLPFRYAFSTGAPMYGRLPTEAEQRKVEGDPEKRPKPQKLGTWSSGHEELADGPPVVGADPVPELFKSGKTTPVHWGTDKRLVRKWIPNGSMLAFSHAFQANGRTWLLSPDLTIVPADRVRPFRTSTFHGVALEGDVMLPLAWARHDAITLWKKGEGGFEPIAEKLPPRTFVRLGEGRVEDGRRVFLETVEPGTFVRESDAAIARQREKLPFGVKDGDKWLEVHIRAGTLVAYVGGKPVFATLVSPGAGGVGPWNGTNDELVKLSATPLGNYRIVWKTRAAAMSPETGAAIGAESGTVVQRSTSSTRLPAKASAMRLATSAEKSARESGRWNFVPARTRPATACERVPSTRILRSWAGHSRASKTRASASASALRFPAERARAFTSTCAGRRAAGLRALKKPA